MPRGWARDPAMKVARLGDPRVAAEWMRFLATFAESRPDWTDGQIARHLHVSEASVAKARELCGVRR